MTLVIMIFDYEWTQKFLGPIASLFNSDEIQITTTHQEKKPEILYFQRRSSTDAEKITPEKLSATQQKTDFLD